jgi:pyridoxamine 5'-phosphate oxidase
MAAEFGGLNESIAHLRGEHKATPLDIGELSRDPFEQFARWLEEALATTTSLPNAMVVATANERGRPSARVVLLKSFDHDGFVFYTNLASRKGNELASNPHAALAFYWNELERQVCITGSVAQVSDEEADEYFASRPHGSKLGAWASHQSEPIDSRDLLDRRLEELATQWPDGNVPRPDYWGGFRLAPVEFEFWQSRPNRLHDRFLYTLGDDGAWSIARLSP